MARAMTIQIADIEHGVDGDTEAISDGGIGHAIGSFSASGTDADHAQGLWIIML